MNKPITDNQNYDIPITLIETGTLIIGLSVVFLMGVYYM